MLWQHDPTEPIGVWADLAEDGQGLAVKGKLTLEASRARDAHALMKAGALNGLSIGFRTVDAERRSGGGRILKQIDLIEISLVSLPAASRARVSDVKSSDDQKGQTAMDEQERQNEQDSDIGFETRAEAIEATVSGVSDRVDAIEATIDSVRKSPNASR